MQPDLDRLAGWWMDGDAETAGHERGHMSPHWSRPTRTEEQLADEMRSRTADLQLVHAVLLHLNQRGRRSSKLELTVPCGPSGSYLRTRRVKRYLPMNNWTSAGAACLAGPLGGRGVVAAGGRKLVYLPASNSAAAAMDRVLAAMDDVADGAYAITVVPSGPTHRAHRPGQGPSNAGANEVPPEHGHHRPGWRNVMSAAATDSSSIVPRPAANR